MERLTITRAYLADLIHQRVGLSRRGSARIVDQVLEEVAQALIQGQAVKVSKFGSFRLRQKRPRIGRNPRTGVEATISARKVILFRPSRTLRKNVNESCGGEQGYLPNLET